MGIEAHAALRPPAAYVPRGEVAKHAWKPARMLSRSAPVTALEGAEDNASTGGLGSVGPVEPPSPLPQPHRVPRASTTQAVLTLIRSSGASPFAQAACYGVRPGGQSPTPACPRNWVRSRLARDSPGSASL